MAVWEVHINVLPIHNRGAVDKDELFAWNGADIPKRALSSLKSVLAPTKSWSRAMTQYGAPDGTRVEILNTGTRRCEIFCRFDLRTLQSRELAAILKFLDEINALICCGDEYYSPDYETVANLLRNSDAARFCANPRQYIAQLPASDI